MSTSQKFHKSLNSHIIIQNLQSIYSLINPLTASTSHRKESNVMSPWEKIIFHCCWRMSISNDAFQFETHLGKLSDRPCMRKASFWFWARTSPLNRDLLGNAKRFGSICTEAHKNIGKETRKDFGIICVDFNCIFFQRASRSQINSKVHLLVSLTGVIPSEIKEGGTAILKSSLRTKVALILSVILS